MMHNQRKPRSEYWREQIRRAEEFPGTATEFCRRGGLSLAAFYSWPRKFKADAKKKLVSPFVAVEVMPERASQLPDPKWVAEIIRHLACEVGA
jgi:hypothetical protein